MDSIERIEEKRYSISEVSAITGVKEPTLRKWEKDFDLDIARDDLNRRYYTDKDVAILKTVIELKEKGINIHGIRRVLKEAIEPVEQENQIVISDSISGNEVLMVLLKQLSIIIFRREEELAEKIKKEVIQELSKQNEYMREENQKLMKYLEKLRSNGRLEPKKKSFLQRLFTKKNN